MGDNPETSPFRDPAAFLGTDLEILPRLNEHIGLFVPLDRPELSAGGSFARFSLFGLLANPQAPVLVFLCAES